MNEERLVGCPVGVLSAFSILLWPIYSCLFSKTLSA
jgi:hypothetical protein